MNKHCDYCGAILVGVPTMNWMECPCCGEGKTLLECMDQKPLELLHGTQCECCLGEGYVLESREERHDYGDTYATEYVDEAVDCEECDGKGFEPDPTACVVCGLDVEDGWNLGGWEVHEDCHCGMTTSEVPKREGWD